MADLPIGDYAFLSDCHATALVSHGGSVDWACLRRFDGGSAFARLLDHDRGGHWSIRPVDEVVARSRRYLPDTMVLETTLTTTSGTVRLTDALAMQRGGAQDPLGHLVRRIEGVDGEVEVELVVQPRFDYGGTRPWWRAHDGGRFSAVGGADAMVVHATCELAIDRARARLAGHCRLGADDVELVVLASQAAHELRPDQVDVAAAAAELDDTVQWWEEWSASTRAEGPHADLVQRSAIVLKGLTCAPTGAIVAAPTTSLPEVPGGSANWDYRYSWIRDATFSLAALAAVGHPEVAKGFRDFVMRSSAGDGGDLQIMYGPYGARRLPEFEVDLDGWRGSRPVRVGNAAATQVQLDVYGHLLGAAHRWHGMEEDLDDDEWRYLAAVVDRAVEVSHQPDAGIWELRGEPRHHVHSKVLLWVALDCGIALVDEYHLDTTGLDVDRWRARREALRTEIEDRGVDHDAGHFVQHYDGDEVDASLLQLALVGFVAADDPRMVATTDAIVDRLAMPPHGFLRRFLPGPDQPQADGEGTFLLCSFWLVEVLALQGRRDEAAGLLDALAATANDLGLFAEEYDPASGELLGNFPQAFTHLGMVAAQQRLYA